MTTKRSLPQIDSLDRRHALLVGAAGCLVACSGDDGGGGDDDSGGDDAAVPGDDAQTTGGDDAQTTGGDDAQTMGCTPGPRSVGTVASIAVGSWTLNSSARVIVARDVAGLFAYSSICTHQGCALTSVNRTSGSTTCRCHGASYDGNGNVTGGPARRALAHVAVTVCDGTVYVDTATSVPATDRVAV